MALEQPLEVLVRTHIKYSRLETDIYTGAIPEDSYWASLGCYPIAISRKQGGRVSGKLQVAWADVPKLMWLQEWFWRPVLDLGSFYMKWNKKG